MNKNSIVLPFILYSLVAGGQVAQVEVKDSTFIQAMETFLDSTAHLKFDYPVVILAELGKLEVRRVDEAYDHPTHGRLVKIRSVLSYELTLTLERNLDKFKVVMPSFSFYYKEKQVLVAFKVEELFTLTDDYRAKVIREAKKTFRGSFKGSSIVAYMSISVEGRSMKVVDFVH